MTKPQKVEHTIERGRGATYNSGKWTVYQHGTYPRHSVLAGQPQRIWVESYDSLGEAQKAFPGATVIEGTTYQPPNLSHLTDDGEEYYSREDVGNYDDWDNGCE